MRIFDFFLGNEDPSSIKTPLPYLLLSKFDQWNIDTIEVNNEKIEIRGWAIIPIYIDYVFAIKHAGRMYFFDEIIFPGDRADINDIFWYYDKNRYYIGAFVCKLGLKDMIFDRESDFEFQLINRKTNLSICDIHKFYFPNYLIPEKSQIKKNIKRTTGSDDFNNYILQGYTIYKNIIDIITKYKLNLNNLKILDFGCGSGRVLSHFSNNNVNIEGADIDDNNLKLCKREFMFAKFHLFPLYPPTNLEAEDFDIIYGISVFTHLNEDTQFKWLKELNRLTKKGGYVLLSIHSDIALSRGKVDFSILERYIYNGFIYYSQDSSGIKKYIHKNKYYGLTYHSHKYIYLNWIKFFEIIDIIPGGICNFQDMVIMRKRQ